MSTAPADDTTYQVAFTGAVLERELALTEARAVYAEMCAEAESNFTSAILLAAVEHWSRT